MAGRIRASDIEEVKRRVNLADLVADHVTLKNAGVDSMKGLCPFHDERSPSFHVRPALGYYHCFGCGESGDAITFLQRQDHLTFTEAVERLAARIHYVLTYEEGGQRREDGPNRARLLAANQAAAAYFVEQLASDEAQTAREFLSARGFDEQACAHFGVGYAPRGWDGMSTALTAQGYTPAELIQAGLASEGRRGAYDRFRGRILWPIRDTSGQVLGFGARKLYDDDTGPKYLNTPETPVYHKSQVLYGLDLAKKAIARGKRAVIVEGYTDVMACHLAGIDSAVATCGTAFGTDHISVLRRIMGDDSSGEVIFTFDPDEAGQKAALRAFAEEKRFTAQTYVAIAPEGFDPSDLRLERGDEAVRELFNAKQPLFEFALRQAVAKFDLNSVEGRTLALRAAAPIVAEIRDPSLRPGYARELARMLGLELSEVQAAVRRGGSAGGRGQQRTQQHAQQRPAQQAQYAASGFNDSYGAGQQADFGGFDPAQGGGDAFGGSGAQQQPARRISMNALRNAPTTLLERDALMAMLQQPAGIGIDLLSQAATAQMFEPDLAVVRDAIAQAIAVAGESTLEGVLASAPESHRGLVRELAMAPMPERRAEQLPVYAREVVISLLDRDLVSLGRELRARLQRLPDVTDADGRRIQEQLVALEAARRGLRSN